MCPVGVHSVNALPRSLRCASQITRHFGRDDNLLELGAQIEFGRPLFFGIGCGRVGQLDRYEAKTNFNKRAA